MMRGRGWRVVLGACLLAALTAAWFYWFSLAVATPGGSPVPDAVVSITPPAATLMAAAPIKVPPAAARFGTKPRYAPHDLLVRFDANTSTAEQEEIARRIGGTIAKNFPRLGLSLIALPDGLDPLAAQHQLASSHGIVTAEPNIYYYPSVFPDDPDFALSWALHEAATVSPDDPDMDAPEGWDVNTGGAQVVLAVIDSGIDYNHSDLAANMWSNPREIAGNNIDDDHNGYVDDVHGIDVENGDSDPMDDLGHGTHVAGIIAASGNNGIGSVGVMWQAKLVACKFIGNDGFGTLTGALACLDYVAHLRDAGVTVVATNNSWGSLTSSQLLDDAINAQQQRGIVFVAAAGNDAANTDQTPQYPSAYSDDIIISVAATDRTGRLAYFSNYGATSVDIGAPGTDIYSTLPGNQWGYKSGTSMATPHITGLVGLLAATDPRMTAADIKARILATGTQDSWLSGKTVSGRRAHIDLPAVDSDNDGMPNHWEVDFGLNPNDASDAAADPDGDGLANLEEFTRHLNPLVADTDGDGLKDGDEVHVYHTNPLLPDTDNDGLSDGAEVTVYGSSPTAVDSDGDGLGDANEVAVGTSPARSDTDGDGLPDGWEIEFGFEPIHTNDAGGDADADGLSNREEFTAGTNPRAIDTDSDGLTDFDEIRVTLTSPTNSDTDNDGMLDGWEVRFGFNPRDASDALSDADGDGYANRTEARAGSDPHDATSKPPLLAWTTVQGNATHTGELRVPTAGADFSVRWQAPIPLAYAGHLTIDSGMVFVNDVRTGVSVGAISLLDGSTVWNTPLVEANPLGSMTVLGQTAYQISWHGYEVRLRAVDKTTGTPRFSVPLLDDDQSWPRSIVPQANRLFAREGGQIVSFDATTGARVWATDVAAFGNGLNPEVVPAVDPDHVVVYAGDTLSALDRATGAVVFENKSTTCNLSGKAKVAVDEAGDAYVAHGGCLTKFDVSAHSVVWEITGIDETVAPAISGNTLYVSTGSALRAVDSATGVERWHRDLPGYASSILVTLNHVFVSTSGGTFAIDLTTHQTTWSYPAFGMLAITDEEALLIWSADGITAINVAHDDDGDGLPNWWERYNGFDYHDAADAALDPDGDGLTNLEEYNHKTSPRRFDSDGDALGDGAEIATYGTNPLLFDTDGDGLGDGREVNQVMTNPLRIDTDGDGVSDGNEVDSYQTNPRDPQSHPNLLGDYKESFEQGTATGWVQILGQWIIAANDASQGRSSLQVDPNLPIGGRAYIRFETAFAGGDFAFDAHRGAGDGQTPTATAWGIRQVRIDSASWQRYAMHIPQGQHIVQFEYWKLGAPTDAGDRGLWIDNVTFRKPQPFAARSDRLLLLTNAGLAEYARGAPTRAPFPIQTTTGNFLGLALTSTHRIAIADPPQLRLFDPVNETVSTTVVPGWQGVRDGIAAVGDFIFATNTGGVPGLLRFRADGTFRDVVSLGSFYYPLSGGRDGFLYALNAQTGGIEKIDPVTMAVLNSRPCDQCSGFAVNAQGQLYEAVGGEIRRVGSNGQVLASLQTNLYVTAIDFAADGSLRFNTGNAYGVAAADLTSFQTFDVGDTILALAAVTRGGHDTDSDGMPDWWEEQYGLAVGTKDAGADRDGDGLTNLQEFNDSTAPDTADTDHDGVRDRDEVVVYASDPLMEDTDGDRVWDGDEVQQGTSLVLADSDGDGITDGREAFYRTNPRVADSDGDGMPDGWEVAHALDPLSAADAGLDPDGDGLINRDEYGAGTDVAQADSDGDGLNDGAEVHQYSTNPTEGDTDADDMSDGWEVANGFNPRVADSSGDADGDGFANRLEFFAGSNPRDPNSIPVAAPWTTFQGGAEHRGYVAVSLDPSDLRESWRGNVLPNDGWPTHAVAANGKVFVTPSVGRPRVVALNGHTGAVLWSKDFGGTSNTGMGAAALANDRVYVQTNGAQNMLLSSMDQSSGTMLSQTSFVSRGSVIPALTPYAGDLFGFDDYGGTARYNGASGARRWTYDAFADSYGSVAAVDGSAVYLYQWSDTNQFVIIDRATGQVRDRINDAQFGGGSISMAPVLGSRHDVILAQGGRLMSFDLGAKKFTWQRSGKFAGQPSFANGVIYAIDDGDLVAADDRTGAELWRWITADPITHPILMTLTHAIVSTDYATYAIDLSTHQDVWNFPKPGELTIGNDGMLYVAGNDGVLVAIRTFVDADGDGMADDWERAHGLDPNNAGDAALDADSDGLTNLKEYFASTDPVRSDSDGDRVNDGTEVLNKTDPLRPDSDLDGLDDGDEIAASTNPLNADTDGDGLNDGREVHQLLTNPTNADSDGDGFNDGWEVDQGSDPLNAASRPSAVQRLTESFESGALPSRWANGINANAGWEVVKDGNAADGLYRARSAPIGHNQIAAVEWTEYFLDSQIQYSAYVSSESGDEMRVFLDGQLTRVIRNKSWTTNSLTLAPGFHTLRWEYAKNQSLVGGDDRAYLDFVRLMPPDTDHDQMDDVWERANGFDPNDPGDANLDADNDGLTNRTEYDLGTFPRDSDTDNDGMPDGWEVNAALDPLVDDANLDPDHDGATNAQEYAASTDPHNASSKPPVAGGGGGGGVGGGGGGGGGGTIDPVSLLLLLAVALLRRRRSY